MSRILTYTKKMFDPLNPEPDLMEIRDVAHALSMLCRANGHFKSFYSVGQHCLNCAREAEARGHSKTVQLACLLHDGSEAYVSDLTRPVKKELPRYLEIEEPLQEAVWQKWLGRLLTPEENAQVFQIDDDILAHEFIQLMEYPLTEVPPVLKSQPVFAFMGFENCQTQYLELFDRLTKERNGENL